MRRSRWIVPVVSLALSGALAGCGSLAERTGGDALAPGSGGGDLAVDTRGEGGELLPDAAAGDAGTDPAGAAPGVTGGSGGSTGSAGSTGPADGASGGGGTGAAGGAGGAASPIKVGVTYPDTAAIAAVFGQDASASDPKTWINRIITYVNKTGGIAGRQISPLWYKADVAEDASTSGQRACAAFTQDNKVDFVVNTGVAGDTLPACLARSGVSMMGGQPTDTVDMRRLRNLFMPNSIRADRMYEALVKLSAERGLLPKGAKLGVVVEDCPWGNRTYDGRLVPLAKRLGVTLVKGTHRCVTNIVSDLGPVTNDMQREALRFASSGVTHVVFVSFSEAFVVSRFTSQANDQSYYPKYFVTSNAYPFNNTRSDSTVKHHETALPNMTGFGYNPLLDVGPLATYDTPGQKAAQEKCKKADPKEGIYAEQKGKDDGYYFSAGVIRGYCDAFFVLKATLEQNGVKFGLADFTRGYQTALDGKLSSTLNAGGFFRVPKDGIDGIGLVRPFAWDATKKQFVYSGAAKVVP